MKKIIIAAIGFSAFILSATTSFAASAVLRNGGFGQVASNSQSFGVSVCNRGSSTLNDSVPVSLLVGGTTATVGSASGINAGSCAYSYVNYSDLNMNPGQTYDVQVAIDPDHTVISNSDNSTTYSVTVPGEVVAVVETSADSNATANVNSQAGNFFANIWNWFIGLFR